MHIVLVLIAQPFFVTTDRELAIWITRRPIALLVRAVGRLFALFSLISDIAGIVRAYIIVVFANSLAFQVNGKKQDLDLAYQKFDKDLKISESIFINASLSSDSLIRLTKIPIRLQVQGLKFFLIWKLLLPAVINWIIRIIRRWNDDWVLLFD